MGYQHVHSATGAGVTDHGALTGLSDDDHVQYAKKASNLSDLTDAATARTNLGLGTAATTATTAYAAATHASTHSSGGADAVHPKDLGARKTAEITTGESNMPIWAISNAACSTSNQTLRLAYFEAQKTESITSIKVASGSTAAGATPTLVRYGVYSVDGSGNLTLIYSTTNDTAVFASTSTPYTKALDSSWSKVRGTTYAIGVLVVTGATAPTLQGQSMSATALFAGPPKFTAAVTGQSDLPSSVAVGSLTTSASNFYFETVP